ncbi:MAG: ABC transporter ATP-binding protein [Proteobacteria bacterium]|nr:MAG: ABC transporter ATP-binding protein [Pseudomonadota bacterium]
MSKQRPKRLFDDLKDLGRLWPFLKNHKKALIISCTLIPLISILQMSVPFILKRTIDQGVLKGDFQFLTYGAIAYLSVVVVEYFVRATQSILTSRAVFQMIRDMRMALIDHIMRLSARYHDRNLSGALVTRATSDFDNLSESLNQGVLSSVVDLAVLAGAVVGLFLLDWHLALITICVLPFVLVTINFFSRALKQSMLLARVKIAALNAYTQECLYGVNTVKVLSGQPDTEKKFDRLTLEYRDAQMKSVVSDAVLFSLLDGIASITIGLVLWFTIRPSDTILSAGIMIAFVQYVQNLFDPLKQLANKIAMLQGAFTAIDRVFSIFDTKEFISGDEPSEVLLGKVEFVDLSFSYNPPTPTLEHVSFAIPAGESLALVGTTGSGKSTIVKLLSKLYTGYTGDIRIDNQSLEKMDGVGLRRKIAIVPQDIVIFKGSVSFNIGLGDPEISQDMIEEAARYVEADRFIQRLPGVYEYQLREGGDDISVGQRQLIAFARAIVRNPKIIILDEATSSVDPASDGIIQRAIEKLFSGRTLIVIAHRLSTIRRCDMIAVLEKGKILEMGNHGDLIQKQGKYYSLHEKLLHDGPEAS